jgi:hypothetical protein
MSHAIDHQCRRNIAAICPQSYSVLRKLALQRLTRSRNRPAASDDVRSKFSGQNIAIPHACGKAPATTSELRKALSRVIADCEKPPITARFGLVVNDEYPCTYRQF